MCLRPIAPVLPVAGGRAAPVPGARRLVAGDERSKCGWNGPPGDPEWVGRPGRGRALEPRQDPGNVGV